MAMAAFDGGGDGLRRLCNDEAKMAIDTRGGGWQQWASVQCLTVAMDKGGHWCLRVAMMDISCFGGER